MALLSAPHWVNVLRMSKNQWNNFDLYNPTEEHQMLRQTVREFVVKEVEAQAAEFDRKEQFNLPLFRRLGDLGLLGITVAEPYGGSGMDAISAVIAHEEISASDPGFCLAYLAHAALCANNIAVNANEEQKKRWLPKLCNGEWVGSMAMSEPHVGTDVLGMKTAVVKKGDKYILNGRKMWITNGTLDEKNTPSDCVLVYAKSGEKDGRTQISTFVVEKGFKGYSVGQKIKDKLGMRASNTAELVFQDCEVPVANLVGHEGDSVMHMMRNLQIERLTLSLSASRPFITGISTSSVTTSGFSRSAFSTPWRPSTAVSITLKRGSRSMLRVRAVRMNAESSTTRTRMGLAIRCLRLCATQQRPGDGPVREPRDAGARKRKLSMHRF